MFSLLPNRILIIFVEVNMYVLYLMYMYSPTKDASECTEYVMQCRWDTWDSKQTRPSMNKSNLRCILVCLARRIRLKKNAMPLKNLDQIQLSTIYMIDNTLWNTAQTNCGGYRERTKGFKIQSLYSRSPNLCLNRGDYPWLIATQDRKTKCRMY